jgi:hypothetical protein
MKPKDFLDRLMKAEGMNSNSLSKVTRHQTKQPQIHRFLAGGVAEPRRSTWAPVAKLFGVPIDAFFDDAVAERAWADYEARKRGGWTVEVPAEHEEEPEVDISDPIRAVAKLMPYLTHADQQLVLQRVMALMPTHVGPPAQGASSGGSGPPTGQRRPADGRSGMTAPALILPFTLRPVHPAKGGCHPRDSAPPSVGAYVQCIKGAWGLF